MSTDIDSVERFSRGAGPLEAALVVVAVGALALYAVGLLFLPLALDFAGLVTGLLAVAVTVLWIGDAI